MEEESESSHLDGSLLLNEWLCDAAELFGTLFIKLQGTLELARGGFIMSLIVIFIR
jgi:hypothetical protein